MPWLSPVDCELTTRQQHGEVFIGISGTEKKSQEGHEQLLVGLPLNSRVLRRSKPGENATVDAGESTRSNSHATTPAATWGRRVEVGREVSGVLAPTGGRVFSRLAVVDAVFFFLCLQAHGTSGGISRAN